MYSKLWAASGVEYPRAARSTDRARPRAARGEAAAAHQRHMIARPRRAWLLTAACVIAVATTVTLAAPAGGPQRRGRPPSAGAAPLPRRPIGRPSSAAKNRSRAPTTSSSTHASTRSTPSCAAPAARRRPKPATCSPRPRCGGASCSIPENRVARRRVQHRRSTGRSARPKSGPSARRTTPRRGSTSAAPTRRACSGGCCATRSSRRRATASASSRRSSARSSWRPASRTRTSASGCTRYYADVAPAAAKFLRFLLLLPGGDKTEGLAQMLRARNGGRLLQGEADYQLHLIYLWYERQTRARARAAARPPEALSGQSALPRADRRHPGRLPARHHRQPRHLARAAGSSRASSASTCRRSPKRRRGSASPGSSRSLQQTDHAIELLAGA